MTYKREIPTVINDATIKLAKPLWEPGHAPFGGRTETVNELVDDNRAIRLLDASPGNRKISQDRVEYFANKLRNGQFVQYTVITIDTIGLNRDRHHTLLSIVKTGIPAMFKVQYNTPEDLCRIIDMTKGRTRDDTGRLLHGVTDTNDLSSTLAAIRKADRTGWSPSNDFNDVIQGMEPYMEGYRAIVEVFGKTGKWDTAAVKAPFVYAYDVDPVGVREFARRVRNREFYGASDPAGLVYDIVMDGNFAGEKPRQIAFRRILRGIQLGLAGETTTKLVDGPTALEAFKKRKSQAEASYPRGVRFA